VLRTYWYDGAHEGLPTADHLSISRLDGVKLRLGRLSAGRQKGVDALIIRDLMTLARERAVATAYLLGGDEDLRAGVEAAQDMGVRVSVIGIESVGERNQADTLIREADEHVVLGKDFLARFLTPVVTPPKTAIAPGTDVPALVVQRAAAFAREWIAEATDDEIARLLGQRPVIPKGLDAQLLQHVQAVAGALDDREPLRRSARETFWQEAAVSQASGVPGP
jgi:hypothetical protein